MALPFSQWAQELGDYAGLTGVSAVGMSACSPRGFPGTLQGIILLDASRMNLDGSWSCGWLRAWYSK